MLSMMIKIGTVKKWCTIIGALLLMLPIGLPWYWGNMAAYALSYLQMRGQTDAGVQTPWIISFYFLFNAIGLFIAGFLSKHTGKRWSLLVGMVLYLGGIFLTYLMVKKSVMMVTLSIGFIAGLGGGLINGMALQYAVCCAGSDLGFVTSFVQSGYNAGPIFINSFVTWYVNPENFTPDLEIGESMLFSQDSVLDQVPSLFLMFGLLCCSLQFVGFLLVRDFDGKKPEDEMIDTSNGETQFVLQEMPVKKVNSGALDEHVDMKPSEIIKTKQFYTLCFSLMMFDNAMLVLANYYKQYGAECIQDDHFLTYLGTVLTLAMTVSFPAWGYLTDRIGVKRSLIKMYAVSSILYFFMYFTPKLDRWAYMVNVALCGGFLPPIFSIIIIATCKLFGKTNYSSNIGVVASLSLLVNFVNPMIFESILQTGWFYVFCYAGSLTTAAMVLVVIALPDI